MGGKKTKHRLYKTHKKLLIMIMKMVEKKSQNTSKQRRRFIQNIEENLS